MNTGEAMTAALKNIPKAVVSGIVDMESGMLLEIKNKTKSPSRGF